MTNGIKLGVVGFGLLAMMLIVTLILGIIAAADVTILSELWYWIAAYVASILLAIAPCSYPPVP